MPLRLSLSDGFLERSHLLGDGAVHHAKFLRGLREVYALNAGVEARAETCLCNEGERSASRIPCCRGRSRFQGLGDEQSAQDTQRLLPDRRCCTPQVRHRLTALKQSLLDLLKGSAGVNPHAQHTRRRRRRSLPLGSAGMRGAVVADCQVRLVERPSSSAVCGRLCLRQRPRRRLLPWPGGDLGDGLQHNSQSLVCKGLQGHAEGGAAAVRPGGQGEDS